MSLVPESARYTVLFVRDGGLWRASCPTLGVEASGTTRDHARTALWDNARPVLAGLTQLAGDEQAERIYAEQMVVTRIGKQNLLGTAAGEVPAHGPYEGDDGSVFLRESLVAALDEMGTSRKWLADFDDAKLRDRKVLLDATVGRLVPEVTVGIESVASYTDNVLYAVPVDGDLDSAMVQLFVTVADLQLRLAVRGTLCRGGVAVGAHHASPRLIVGPAVVRAHDVESKLARVPRVLLDGPVAEGAARSVATHAAASDSDLLRSLLLVDSDGGVFISYLDLPDLFEDHPGSDTTATVELHRDAISAGLRAHAGSDVAAKWQWAATYHNFVVADRKLSQSLAITDNPLLTGPQFARLPDAAANVAPSE